MKILSPQTRTRLLATLLLVPAMANGQEPERWFQIEVSVFSNERTADREEEVWSPERLALAYPGNLQHLGSLFELLMTSALQPTAASTSASTDASNQTAPSQSGVPEEPSAQDIRREIIDATGPFPPPAGDGYRFPDFARDAFLQLPGSESEFLQTNRALERSPEHRLLFHGVWRQPVPDPGAELPVAIKGGARFGEHWELEGSLSFHFNNNRDRVVVDSNLWLTEFAAALQSAQSGSPERLATEDETTEAEPEPATWQLPELPAQLAPVVMSVPDLSATGTGSETMATNYAPRIIYHLAQSREMRSNEFHYLDHPALGLVVTVFPYEVPPLPEAPTETPESVLEETTALEQSVSQSQGQ